MTEHERLRIIAFLERVRQPFQDLIPIADEDATWNMLLFLIKSHLTGTPVTLSALASVANVPHATAMRRIHALIESGHIETAAFRDARKVSYLPQPRGPGGVSNNPIGGFLLCIPSNLPGNRIERAFEAIAWMTSTEAMKANAQNGCPVAPRFSVSADRGGGRNIPDRQRGREARKARPAQGLASATGARISVARGDSRRRNPPGSAGGGVGSGGARQCAGRGRQGHARSRVLLGACCDPSAASAHQDGRACSFRPYSCAPNRRPRCNFEERARWTKRSVSGREAGQKRSKRRA
jgi:hypothetical protein